ncbi:MAG: ABC transporter ATP-binding protein [Gammaproteobacteria bacterium]|nr:ABC transporter ATP-binding protein [Gammaproteobacteria bacterium]
MIKIHNLNFEYPGILALDNVSLRVERGDITALVGPNGAGKTTLLRCIAALETPISGAISINGIDVLNNPRQVHRQLGYLADFYGLYGQLSVNQSLRYAAMAHSIAQEKVNDAVQRAAERLEIADRLSQKVATLSRGLTQRVAIAQAIVHEPQLLLLDEPASGLDPEARHSLSELFLSLQAQGMTLVVSSHILAELEEYSTSMVIIRDGKIVEHQQLKDRAGQAILVRVMTSKPSPALIAKLAEHNGVQLVESGETSCLFRFTGDDQAVHEILAALIRHNVPVCHFGQDKINMHDAYLARVAQLKQEAAP